MPNSINTIADLLKNNPLFLSFPDETLKRVTRNALIKEFSAGDYIFQQGGKADYFFLLVEGQVQLTRGSEAGREKVIDIVQKNHLFAEALALKEVEGYPVNAKVIKKAKVVYIDCKVFKSILLESSELCIDLMASLSIRLHGLIKEIDRLTLHNASYRLINYLLEQKTDASGFLLLSAPKQVIASRVSIEPETLSRILKKLANHGLIETKSNTIQIIDRVGMSQFLKFD